ncbi:hypothetical protein LINPERHAP1_LOCUS20376 [Linum perenne]
MQKDQDVEPPILEEHSDSSSESGFEEEGNELSDEDFEHLIEHENIVSIPFHGVRAEDTTENGERRWESEEAEGEVRQNEGDNSKRYIRIDKEVDSDINSDCADSDELESIYSSDENGEVERQRYPEFHADKELDNPSFYVNLIFPGFDILKTAIKNYSLNNKKPLRFKHSDPKRLEAVCQVGCPWRIWASRRQDGRVQIKKASLIHSGCIPTFKNKFGDHKYIANKYLQRFQVDPNWSVKSIMQTVQEDLHMRISESKARRIRRTANKLVQGTEADQYSELHEYCAELRRSNIGSTIFAETNEDGVFRRMYCCLGACKEGFLAGCRKVIGIDGCFLKTVYRGQLLSAVALDANNGIFPIAYAVVRVENEDNWSWFLHTLSHDLDITSSSEDWTFMSDKQKVNYYLLAIYEYIILTYSYYFCQCIYHCHFS